MAKNKIEHWITIVGKPYAINTRKEGRKRIKKLREKNQLNANTFVYLGKVIGKKIILDLNE